MLSLQFERREDQIVSPQFSLKQKIWLRFGDWCNERKITIWFIPFRMISIESTMFIFHSCLCELTLFISDSFGSLKNQVGKRQRQWYMITSVCVAHAGGWLLPSGNEWIWWDPYENSVCQQQSRKSHPNICTVHNFVNIKPMYLSNDNETTFWSDMALNFNSNWLVQKQKSYWSFSREERFTLGTMWIMWTWIHHRKLVWYVHYGF